MKKLLPTLILSMLCSITLVAQLSWSKYEHDFGISQQNVPLAYEFKYINYSTKTVSISYIKTTCNCLAPKWTKKTLAPGEIGEMMVKYKPKTNGSYKETIKVYLDNNPYPQEITVTGTIGEGNPLPYHEPALTNVSPQKPQLTPPDFSNKPTNVSVPSINPKQNQTPPGKTTKPTKATLTPPKKVSKPATSTTIAGNSNNNALSTAIMPRYIGGESLNTAVNERYLSRREKAMIREINLVRSNPKAYVKVVEAYVKEMKADESYASFYADDIAEAAGLIEELKRIPNLSILKPSQQIHQAAKDHGIEAKNKGSLDHRGSNGSMPWDRVTKYDNKMQDGNENLVGGMNDVRKSVLTLLLDSGIPGHLHRKTFLEPKWTHVSCYEVGTVGNMPFSWIQNYGQAKGATNPTNNKPSVIPPGKVSKPSKPTTNKPTKPQSTNTGSNIPSKPNSVATSTNKPTKPQSTNTGNNIPSKPNSATISTNKPAFTSDLSTNIATDYLGGDNLNTAVNESYLSKREKAMIKEINLIRSNPKAYIKVIETYVDIMKADKDNASFYADEINDAAGLIEELRKTPTLSILKPSKGIYDAAKVHGDDGKNKGNLDHQGSDGFWPWDRVVKYDKNMKDGNENLVGGMRDVRKSVLALLIDAGIPNNGHRKALLDPKWTHVSCYEVGTVGNMPYMWIQKFGQSKEGHSSMNPVIPGQASPYDAVTTYDTDTKPKPGKSQGSSMANRPTPNRTISKTIPSRPNSGASNNAANNNITNPPSKPQATQKPILNTTNLAVSIVPDKKCYTANKEPYMNNNEKEMVAEINFLRTNPKGYIEIIEAYIDFVDNEISKDESARIFYNKELKSAEELIELLERIQPLNRLKPDRGMYKAATFHGEDGKATGNLVKESSDGSMPHNRIMRHSEKMMDGDENLPYGSSNVRYSIVRLLIDKDDFKRQQRKILLNPNWDYVAIYEVGKVSNMHYWVQDFGQVRPEFKPMHDMGSVITEKENPILAYANTETLTETMISTEIQPNKTVFDESNVNYLSIKEQMLLREINFLRANPEQYALILDKYIQNLNDKKQQNASKKEFYDKRIEAAYFVKDKLANSKKGTLLKPNQSVYQAAYQHGEDCKKSNSLTHWGSDGSNTWQRLQKNAPSITDGDQCLVGDTDDVRELVIKILIDHAVYSRNREFVLLKSNWTSFGASAVGQVGKRTDCWVITFGQF